MIQYKDIEVGRQYQITHSNKGVFVGLVNCISPDFNRLQVKVINIFKGYTLTEGQILYCSLDLCTFTREVSA